MPMRHTSLTYPIPDAARDWIPVPEVQSAWLLSYDPRRYPFAKWLAANIYRVSDLESMHVNYLRFKRRRDPGAVLGYDDNLLLRAMMQRLDDSSTFWTLYFGFVHGVIAPAFGTRISYSRRPKMRVHLAGTPGVSVPHRDADVTRRPEQVNVWLPFTDTFAGNTIWVETDYGRGDHRPIAVRYGQALLFDGGLLSHGTVGNDTSSSRVSLDLRFAVLSEKGKDAETLILGGRPDYSPALPDAATGRHAFHESNSAIYGFDSRQQVTTS